MNRRKTFISFLLCGIAIAFVIMSCSEGLLGDMDTLRQKAEGGKTVPPDTTVYYTVTFDSKGGSTVPRQNVKDGETVIRPEDPTKAGSLNFADWYRDEGFSEKYSFDTPVTGNIILYARWSSNSVYNINFNSMGGTAIALQNVIDGDYLVRPNDPKLRGNRLVGWYNESNYLSEWDFAMHKPYQNMMLYAKWSEVSNITDDVTKAYFADDNATSVTVKFDWLASNYLKGKEYTITASADELSFAPRTLSTTTEYSNYKITLSGSGGVRTITLSENGSMFTINSGVTLVLGNNITLQGRAPNTDTLVMVNSGGELVMNSGSTITDNTRYNVGSGGGGGGVYVAGKLTMKTGSAVTNNGAAGANNSMCGGGVYVAATGIFAMEGGTISGNQAATTKAIPYGGGVYVAGGGSFTKTGGIIYGYTSGDPNSNEVKSQGSTTSNGYAVYVASSPAKRRETTAGSGVNLDSSKTGTEGGWEN